MTRSSWGTWRSMATPKIATVEARCAECGGELGNAYFAGVPLSLSGRGDVCVECHTRIFAGGNVRLDTPPVGQPTLDDLFGEAVEVELRVLCECGDQTKVGVAIQCRQCGGWRV